MGRVACSRVGPIVCVQSPVQCRTSVGCSGPIAASSQVALVGALHKALADLLE